MPLAGWRVVAESMPATYIAFDQLYDRFESVIGSPCSERRDLARQTGAGLASKQIVMSEGIVGAGSERSGAAFEYGASTLEEPRAGACTPLVGRVRVRVRAAAAEVRSATSALARVLSFAGTFPAEYRVVIP